MLGAALLLGGCASSLRPFEVAEARPGLQSNAHSALTDLPAPQQKVVAAVYRFRDQTGQYKPTEGGSTFSTAVTQGATAILMRALEESGWFVPIEREGLSNLLNERQIIQSIRAQNAGPDGEGLGALPPLLYAGVILEGGVVGYDTNVLTGGAGARYFGIGASGEYRQDQVTIYLRAVSTQSGRVLKSVHTTKTILSQKLDGGAFVFVEVDRLLEAEAGYSFNEPPVLAVTEAIEQAVKSLVIEGVRENLWSLQDPDMARSDPAFAQYDAEKAGAAQRDYFDRPVRRGQNRPGVGFGLGGGVQRYQGNYLDPLTRPTASVHLRGNLTPRWALGGTVSAGELAADRAFAGAYLAADLHAVYYLLPESRLTPFVQAGGGVLMREAVERQRTDDQVFPYLAGAAGLELMATPQLGLSVSLGNDYALIDGLDGVTGGTGHDSIWSLRTGLTWYLFD
jgi:curli production assembly/transport component CsgG